MATLKKTTIKKGSIPAIKINPELDKYHKMDIFKDKLDRANATLKRVGLPKV